MKFITSTIMKEYNQLKREAPRFPKATCPHIDEAQNQMEILREQNERIREGYHYWRNLYKELLFEVCKLNKYVEELENE